ncbi:MAG: hypothetical protein NPIRA04_23680 [Nitrospirales bacterium]|nr:MAG: hypothetical protein NPIRA04_23680 [Nitrospirales bacterium]
MMNSLREHKSSKRRPVNLTIRADVLNEAKSLKVNASQAAELGIIDAIKKAREQEWIQSHQKALQAHNKRIEKDGPLLTPDWADH